MADRCPCSASAVSSAGCASAAQSLGTKFSGEPCTRPDGPRTLSPENFPVCVPAVGACPPAGTDLKERGKPISEIFSENRLTKPHLCGKIFMLFLRQQALESSVKIGRASCRDRV